MTRDDRTLLRRTHAGHEASARELWDRHAGWMLAYARGVLGASHPGAEDVVQAVFCRVLGLDRGTIRAVRDVRPWLASLVRRTALNHVRGERRAGEREAGRVHQRATADRIQSAPEIAAALAPLPRRLREVLYLRHVAGLTTDQTALALGVPRGTVASRHHAAVAALRTALEEAGERASDLTGEAVHVHAI